MMKITKGLCVALLILVLLESCFCEGCWKEERDRLLEIKHTNFRNSALQSWVNGSDCCQWERVECNTTTGRVAKLDLSAPPDSESFSQGRWYLNFSDFQVFEGLETLNLSINHIVDCIENGSGNESEALRLNNLQALDLSSNSLNESSTLSCLRGLSSLKSLDLSYNNLAAKSVRGLSKLSSLEVLHLSTYFPGEMTNISDYTGLSWSTILENLSGLQHLQLIDLSNTYYGPYSSKELYISFIQGAKNLSSLQVILDGNVIDGSKLLKSLRPFSSLGMLYLRDTMLNGTISAGDLHDLGSLEYLILDSSQNIGTEFFRSIGALTSLRVLSLRECGIKGTLPAESWSELKRLEMLDLSHNKFNGLLPSSFCSMTSLRVLDLSHNHFTGNIAFNLASLTSLESLNFRRNQFQVPASFSFLANHSYLKFIHGGGNKLTPDPIPTQTWVPKFQLQVFNFSSTTETSFHALPSFLLYQYNLTLVDFTGSKYGGVFPNWLLQNNTKLRQLIMRNCSFTGHFQFPSYPIPNVWKIDVSNNFIGGQIQGNITSAIFPNLQFLNMSMNAMNGSLPHEFGQLRSLLILDMSDNHFSGEIPKNLSGASSPLRILMLSNNELDGSIFQILSTFKHLEQSYLDGNYLSGGLPSSFSNTSVKVLDISYNHFVGKLPKEISNSSNLVALSIFGNHLEGSIPRELVELESLLYLDLSNNNLSGSVPSFAHSSLGFIHLRNNRLSGLSSGIFSESSSLSILDLSYNSITGSILDLISDLTQLNILLLKGNNFMGQIPTKLCQLVYLTIIDLSYNSLSGPIPPCLSNIEFIIGGRLDVQALLSGPEDEDGIWATVQQEVDFTTKWTSYTYKKDILMYMTGIDLSHNKLEGNIPIELGNLTRIRAMNLSHNGLTGPIPATFSNLMQIESMDLSYNMLSSRIPPELTALTSLEVFSVAYNNLSGKTPELKGQFITFDESSYEGNPFLCGLPLKKSCNDCMEQPSGFCSSASGAEGGNLDMNDFYTSFMISYTMVLLVMAAVLFINPHWRQAWFYFIEYVSTNCYYFIEDCCYKFQQIIVLLY